MYYLRKFGRALSVLKFIPKCQKIHQHMKGWGGNGVPHGDWYLARGPVTQISF